MQTLQNIRSRYFYPRPPRGGRLFFFSISVLHVDFYPRPPRGGRRAGQRQRAKKDEFLSTPSARRATVGNSQSGGHAQLFLSTPSARRATRAATGVKADILFLSTPSARRATYAPCIFRPCRRFLSTPSARRATRMELEAYGHNKISIHALREEGDMRRSDLRALCHRFLSTPSARRATLQDCAQIYWLCISIHALREEGDFTEMPQTLAELQFLSTPSARRATVPRPCGSYRNPISIHALREEGDECHNKLLPGLHNISIHALREEGDKATFFRHNPQFKFLSTPSARRATARSQVHLCGNGAFLSTPSARRATAKTETKALFSNKLYNILHEFRRALIYNWSKNYPNRAK